MLPRASGIYKIVNSATGKFYIGSAVDFRERWHGHRGALQRGMHKNAHLQAAWNKHGSAAFSMVPIVMCAKADLLFYEQACIDSYRAVERGYNKAPQAGNNVGIIRTPEFNAKIAAAKRGVPKTPEAKAAHAAAMARPETRAKISSSKRGKPKAPVSDAHRLALSASQKGHHVSVETRAKLRAANLGKVNGAHSPETRIKISQAQKGRQFTPEHRAKMSLAQRARFARTYLETEMRIV